MTEPVLQVRDLAVTYHGRRGDVTAVRGVSLTVGAGETVALVGESGSGKSTTALAVAGLLPGRATVTGKLDFRGRDLTTAGRRERRAVLGAGIGLVPQDPTVSLNPVKRIGDQVAEVLLIHRLARRPQAWAAAVEALAAAGLGDPEIRARQYPHELSGGMRQRVLIAIALVAGPALLIADEPTTALDVTVQRQILDRIDDLVGRKRTGLLLVTHDLAVAADRADRIVVMSDGRIVEDGPARRILRDPAHPYTRSLLDAAPALHLSGPVVAVPPAPAGPPLLAVRGLIKDYPGPGKQAFRAVDTVDLDVHAGRTLGLVGESGSGKSTTARLALRLTDPTAGSVVFDGVELTGLPAPRLRQLRRRFQLVQQNPYAALHPKLPVVDIVAEPLRSFGEPRRAARDRATELLDRVQLSAGTGARRAAELSGGQRQRVAIARALALQPDLVVLDEPVSALDVRVQAHVLDLLGDLQRELGVGYLFISHDLAVVRQICHDVAVMYRGRIVETGSVDQVFAAPAHEYTQRLLAAVPGGAVR